MKFILRILSGALDEICLHIFYRLTENDIKEGSLVQLRYVKFQNVSNVTVSMLQFSDLELNCLLKMLTLNLPLATLMEYANSLEPAQAYTK